MKANYVFKYIDRELYSIAMNFTQPVTTALNDELGFNESDKKLRVYQNVTPQGVTTKEGAQGKVDNAFSETEEEQKSRLTIKRGPKKSKGMWENIIEGYLANQDKYTQEQWAIMHHVSDRHFARRLAEYLKERNDRA